MTMAVALAVAYLLGSVPFSYLVARFFGVPDVREVGSGNVGATNVMRSAGRPAGILAFAFDASKGALAALAAQRLGLALEVGDLVPGRERLLAHLRLQLLDLLFQLDHRLLEIQPGAHAIPFREAATNPLGGPCPARVTPDDLAPALANRRRIAFAPRAASTAAAVTPAPFPTPRG